MNKTFTVTFDDRMDANFSRLQKALGKTSKAEVFRLAIALLGVAAEARSHDNQVPITKDGTVLKEILLPE